ncbi:hypothetical protein [Sporosarcina sp. P35]|uniref:hypothetical protein n=2 Tax=Sporosarcina TaxID=1569 RepID=UPI0012F48FCD|nr:hypothetical protein [Sporosarcina sp. P35]
MNKKYLIMYLKRVLVSETIASEEAAANVSAQVLFLEIRAVWASADVQQSLIYFHALPV